MRSFHVCKTVYSFHVQYIEQCTALMYVEEWTAFMDAASLYGSVRERACERPG
jgi:hypothetical protein